MIHLLEIETKRRNPRQIRQLQRSNSVVSSNSLVSSNSDEGEYNCIYCFSGRQRYNDLECTVSGYLAKYVKPEYTHRFCRNEAKVSYRQNFKYTKPEIESKYD